MPTPPVGYGGIERVVHSLGEALLRLGHEVTMFAIPGSRFSGKLVEVEAYHCAKTPGGATSPSRAVSEEPLYNRIVEHLRRHPTDVIHDWSFQNLFIRRHPDSAPCVVSACIPPAPGYRPPNLVACSQAHAKIFTPHARFVRYGLNLDEWEPCFQKSRHFVHLARVDRIKGQHLSMWAARKARARLILAGGVTDPAYYRLLLQPMSLITPTVSFLGEVQGSAGVLRDAAALVQAPRWFDAFPLVVLESFALGTPVISLARGGIAEQVVHGVNGFLCETTADLSHAMAHAGEIKPRDCRDYADEHFSVKRMAADYIAFYEDAIKGVRW